MRELRREFTSAEEQIDAGGPDRTPAVRFRSVAIGMGGVLLVSCFTPYNDWVLGNTFFIGNHFPAGVALVLLVLVLAVNPLLEVIRPGSRLTAGELIVITSMMWVAAAFPTSGLHRYWADVQLAILYYWPMNRDNWANLLPAIPDWMLAVPGNDPENIDVLYYFYHGTRGRPDAHVAWWPWAGAGLRWAVLIVPMFVGVLCLVSILRRQWVQVERLQFPLVHVTLELLRDPEPGRRFNRLFRNRWTWVAAGAVCAIHGLHGLHAYFPEVPELPVSFNLTEAFSEGAWRHLGGHVKLVRIYFSAVGIAFILATEVSLSLWFFSVLFALALMFYGWYGVSYGEAFRTENVGAYMAASVVILFVARRHLWTALRVAALGARSGTSDEREYLGYRPAVLGFLACLLICTLWFRAAGVPLWVGLAAVLSCYMMYLVLARIMAETGMLFIQNVFFADTAVMSTLGPVMTPQQMAVVGVGVMPQGGDLRETLMPYAFNSVRMADASERMRRRLFFGLLVVSVIVAIVASGVAHVGLMSHFGALNNRTFPGRTPGGISPWHFNLYHAMERGVPPLNSGWTYILIGASIYAVLAVGRLLFARWPLHPVGFLLAPTYAISRFWFSILLGWACKTLVMRFGGATLYARLRPAFIGLLVGEALIGGLWMVVKIVLEISGTPGKVVNLMPL